MIEKKSTSVVEVVSIKLETHPNADSLSIIKIFDGGYTCVVRTEDWKDKEIGAYIPPDSIVPNTEQFAFLGEHKRIKVRRFRGILSMGLLVPAPENSKVGDDVADILGIKHYEPPVFINGGQATSAPKGIYAPDYDVDSLRRFLHIVKENEPFYISEKINGENFRCLYDGEKMHVGSHHQWKKEEENSSWWQVLTPEMINFCKCNPNKVLYGEAYGKVGGFKYGKQGVRFIAFDVLDGTNWLDPENFVNLMDEYKIPRVPVLGWNLPFNFEEFKKLAEGRSVLAESFGDNHIREGCVLKPMIERIDLEIGRVLLKIVGDGYYELK